ncbi:hypothetical protein [Leifsonia aquatica]|uniref:hypothetical protein n=1 Tax=Leifsonia aquatica TaxID=144185 RepID=UPI0004696C9B|nr:hypothetical protein [Leifsonia aquatica]
MTLTAADVDGLPHVPISTFKANPAHYLTTGAAVTTHGRVSAAFLPVVDDAARETEPTLETTRAQLRLLSRLVDREAVAEERRRLSVSRDADAVPDPR